MTNHESKILKSITSIYIYLGTAALNARHGKRYSYGPSGQILYPAAGAEDDWAKGVAGIKYAYTLELRPGKCPKQSTWGQYWKIGNDLINHHSFYLALIGFSIYLNFSKLSTNQF